ncbi:peptidylprolyl isomerase [Ornithinimicrobium sufpigmenti]|uniref:peptidylprolyl isomerase n=1 Tax=Ornithinimicrobium sufpigmenti TaxID=2508882 RepID=UPI001EDFCB8B|nr:MULTISPECIES: peptidylprolyl isomerase [unclassified Ornithinimicrobium]
MRRHLLPASALVALVLSGCGDGSPMFGSDTETEDSQETEATEDAGATAPAAALDCEEPPAPPAEPLAFTPEDLPEPHPGDPATVTATLETTCGDIVLELAAAEAPQTVASFAFLAEQGYWDDSPCHRLTTQGIFVLQCGDPTGSGRGNPGYGYGIENAPDDGTYPPGSLAMARTQDPNSNGGQFFIVYDDTMLPTQGGGYSVFGQVTDGLEIVEAIAAQGGQGGAPDGAPAQPISILSVDVEG